MLVPSSWGSEEQGCRPHPSGPGCWRHSRLPGHGYGLPRCALGFWGLFIPLPEGAPVGLGSFGFECVWLAVGYSIRIGHRPSERSESSRDSIQDLIRGPAKVAKVFRTSDGQALYRPEAGQIHRAGLNWCWRRSERACWKRCCLLQVRSNLVLISLRCRLRRSTRSAVISSLAFRSDDNFLAMAPLASIHSFKPT